MTAVTAEKPKTGVRNCSIDIARCMAALLVAANHAGPWKDFKLPRIDLLSTIEHISLPFFFMTAGYFFVCSIMSGKKSLLPYLKRLLIPYTAWSVIYLLIDFFRYGTDNAAEFVKSCFFRFFISGSAYHFWYFPAVMVSAIIVALFFRLRLEKLLLPISFLCYAVFVTGTCYSQFFIEKIPALNILVAAAQVNMALSRLFLIGFPFFCEGYLVKLLMDRNGFLRRNCTAVTAVFAVLFVGEILLFFPYGSSPTYLFGHYFIAFPFMMMLLEHPMQDKKEAAERCRVFAGHTYYAHPLYLMTAEAAYAVFFPTQIPSLLRFVIALLLCFTFSRLIKRINNRYLNMIAC